MERAIDLTEGINNMENDLISRQQAIDVIGKIFPADPMRNDYTQGITCGAALATEYIKQLPSAQPEKHTEERIETHACDLIDRREAIDAILAVTGNSSVRELYEHVQEHELSDMWSGGVNAAIDIIIAVPSAQPERKKGQWTDNNACPLCGFQPWYERDIHTLSFCPNCGADLRKDGD